MFFDYNNFIFLLDVRIRPTSHRTAFFSLFTFHVFKWQVVKSASQISRDYSSFDTPHEETAKISNPCALQAHLNNLDFRLSGGKLIKEKVKRAHWLGVHLIHLAAGKRHHKLSVATVYYNNVVTAVITHIVTFWGHLRKSQILSVNR